MADKSMQVHAIDNGRGLSACTVRSQSWIDRFALKSENAEDALVNSPEWLPLDEPFEPFDPQGELAQRQRALPRKPTFTETLKMFGQGGRQA